MLSEGLYRNRKPVKLKARGKKACFRHGFSHRPVGYVIAKLLVPELRKINSERSEGIILHNAGHEDFIKLTLRLFCFAQRLSFPCDTQKRKSVVTRLN